MQPIPARFECPYCWSSEIVRKPVLGDYGEPTGDEAVYCAVCGYHYGSFAPETIEQIEAATPPTRIMA